MATTPHDPEFTLDIGEQIAHIDQMRANIARAQASTNQMIASTNKVRRETRFAPWMLVTTALGAGAALFAARGAFVKLFIG